MFKECHPRGLHGPRFSIGDRYNCNKFKGREHPQRRYEECVLMIMNYDASTASKQRHKLQPKVRQQTQFSTKTAEPDRAKEQ